jgi:hypothetical protein
VQAYGNWSLAQIQAAPVLCQWLHIMSYPDLTCVFQMPSAKASSFLIVSMCLRALCSSDSPSLLAVAACSGCSGVRMLLSGL